MTSKMNNGSLLVRISPPNRGGDRLTYVISTVYEHLDDKCLEFLKSKWNSEGTKFETVRFSDSFISRVDIIKKHVVAYVWETYEPEEDVCMGIVYDSDQPDVFYFAYYSYESVFATLKETIGKQVMFLDKKHSVDDIFRHSEGVKSEYIGGKPKGAY